MARVSVAGRGWLVAMLCVLAVAATIFFLSRERGEVNKRVVVLPPATPAGVSVQSSERTRTTLSAEGRAPSLASATVTLSQEAGAASRSEERRVGKECRSR